MVRITIIGKKRKDGKYKIRTSYKGAPNMFGGFYPDNIYTSISTPETIKKHFDGYPASYQERILFESTNMEEFCRVESFMLHHVVEDAWDAMLERAAEYKLD